MVSPNGVILSAGVDVMTGRPGRVAAGESDADASRAPTPSRTAHAREECRSMSCSLRAQVRGTNLTVAGRECLYMFALGKRSRNDQLLTPYRCCRTPVRFTPPGRASLRTARA